MSIHCFLFASYVPPCFPSPSPNSFCHFTKNKTIRHSKKKHISQSQVTVPLSPSISVQQTVASPLLREVKKQAVGKRTAASIWKQIFSLFVRYCSAALGWRPINKFHLFLPPFPRKLWSIGWQWVISRVSPEGKARLQSECVCCWANDNDCNDRQLNKYCFMFCGVWVSFFIALFLSGK